MFEPLVFLSLSLSRWLSLTPHTHTHTHTHTHSPPLSLSLSLSLQSNSLTHSTPTTRLPSRYEWTTLDFAWPSDELRFNYTKDGWYIPENCALAGVKVHKGDVSDCLGQTGTS